MVEVIAEHSRFAASLKSNILANYFGQAWRFLMSLVFIPVYIRYLGIEAYGLIGIFAMLQAWLGLLDMGMKPALGREMARFTGGEHTAQSIWDLLRSIEIVSIVIASFVALLIWMASGWLAADWLRVNELPKETVAQALVLMGMVIALQFLESVYISSIAGLQRQVLQNIIVSLVATIRGLGAVGVLIWISPTLNAFFLWQGLISLVSVGIFALVVYRLLPAPSHSASFTLTALISIWRYAAGMIGITFLALLLTQIDKLLLSRLLSLESFGYYVLAGVVAGTLLTLAYPVQAAFFPRFVELIGKKDNDALRIAFHQGSQFVTVVMGSAAAVLMVNSYLILQIWTTDVSLTNRVAPLVAVLVLGTLLNGLVGIPYRMQIAHGWTSLGVLINSTAVAFIVPAILWVVPRYGAMGAAWIWVALNGGYVLIGMHFMYRRILVAEKWEWYRKDIFLPLTVAGMSALTCRWAMPDELTRMEGLITVLVSFLFVLLTTCLSAALIRKKLFSLTAMTYSAFQKLVGLNQNLG